MKSLALLLLVGCSYDASDDPIWRGTVQRDGGPPLAFAGYDPYPAQGYEFGGGIAAMGYIDDDSGKFLVECRLYFSDNDFENAMSTSFPITLPLSDDSLVSGMGVDFIEQPATRAGDSQQTQTFHHEYSQHQANTVSGTFVVTRTDYSTFMDGHLSANVKDPNHGDGTGVRQLEFDVHYHGDK